MSGNGDIVNRLRWKASTPPQPWSGGSAAAGLMLNAADEIERLQALLRRYETMLRTIGSEPCEWSGGAKGLSCLTEGMPPCQSCRVRQSLPTHQGDDR